MTIYSTYSEGKTYIAIDHHFLGTVETYKDESWFSSFFRSSMNVTFGDKERSVNPESYKKLVGALLGKQIQEIEKYANFRKVTRKLDVEDYETYMSDAIPAEHKKKLFHKLAKAISNSDTEKALKYIGKGADIHASYKDRNGIDPSFKWDSDGLSRKKDYKFLVFHGSVVQQAVLKNLTLVVNQLERFGVRLDGFGSEYYFYRKVKVERYSKMHYTPPPIFGPSFKHHLHQRQRDRIDFRAEDDTSEVIRVYFKKKKSGIVIKRVPISEVP